MTATVAERVAAGAAFLDQREPGWDMRIDLDALNLASPCRCVLGQLETDGRGDDESYAHWLAILRSLGLPAPKARDLGFKADDDDPGYADLTYADLTAEWRRVILGRREVTS